MAINIMQTLDVIETLENFLSEKRPPEEMRNQIDLAYKIENQSVIIYEIRPRWDKPEVNIETKVAKATFVKAQQYWRVYWMRSDLKWHIYQPMPNVKTIKEFIDLIEEDKHNCFWG